MSHKEQSYSDLLAEEMAFDLKSGFSNYSIDGKGQIQISNIFSHPVYIGLGSAAMLLGDEGTKFDLLEVTRVSTGDLIDSGDNMFVVRNLRPDSRGEAIEIVDHKPVISLDELRNDINYQPIDRQSTLIGRRAVSGQALDLSEYTSAEHATIRVGNMQGNLHIFDGSYNKDASTNGTTVFIDPRDEDGVGTPRRHFIVDPFMTVEARNGRWSR